MIELGVNIDHVATVRQARRTYEPDPVWAAGEAELGGADQITIHLREDRRHIQDRDVYLLRETVHTRLNLEMSLAEEIVAIACKVKPHIASLVPEKREEVTTEGGLDIIRHAARTGEVVRRLRDAGVIVSAFIDPDAAQVAKAKELGFEAVELHTGSYAEARGAKVDHEFKKLLQASHAANDHKLRLHAGHGLNYINVIPVCALPALREVNIGHSIISRSIFTGLRSAVAEMKRLLETHGPRAFNDRGGA